MDKFKIRCSAIGQIMGGSIGLSETQERKLKAFQDKMKSGKDLTDPQGEENDRLIDLKDNPELPKGAKAYCEKWLKEQLYSRRREIGNKYTDKGNTCEDNAIQFVSECKLMDLEKNETFYQNDFMTGTPDIIGNPIIDTKCSWNEQTFPLFDDEIPDKNYYYQGQGYMSLCGGDKFEVIYCLMNAPFKLIEDEARRESYKSNLSIEELIDKHTALMTFDDVDASLRYKVFSFDKDEKVIAEINKRVEMCREYISTLLEKLGS